MTTGLGVGGEPGAARTERERAATHFNVSATEVTPEMIQELPSRGTGLGLTESRIEEIARSAAREVVEEERAKGELPFHIAEHEATGSGLVVDELKAEATPCKAFTFEGARYGWSPGVVGLISEKRNPDQFARFCKTCIPVSDGVARRFARVKEAVGKAHKEWEREGGGLPQWWEKVGPALQTD